MNDRARSDLAPAQEATGPAARKPNPMRSNEPAEMLFEYLSPLRAFLKDDGVNEVAINRPGEIWTEGRGGWVRHEAPTMDFGACRHLASLIASFNKKGISEKAPILSGSLIYGERAQIAIPPACESGTVSLTVRKPSLYEKTLVELDKEGAFAECTPVVDELQPFELELMQLLKEKRMREFLEMAVLKHRTIMVVGKTGSGKTTVMKSLIRCIPDWERLITIEDVHELFLPHHPNKVHLFYARAEEEGAIVLPKHALASCLRMKPDRILLAELRGDEAWEFIKNVNTGHPGSLTSMHANGAIETFDQLTALIKDSQTGAHLDAGYIRQRLFATVDIVLFYHQRKLREVYYDPERKRRAMV